MSNYISGLNQTKWVTAAIKMEHIYRCSCNSDTVEGRGHDILIGYAETHMAAQMMVKGRGPMGSPGDIEEINVLRIKFEDLDGNDQDIAIDSSHIKGFDNEMNRKARIRSQALAKLTSEERKELGV